MAEGNEGQGPGEDASEAGGAKDSGGPRGALLGAPDRQSRAPTQGVHENRWTKSKTK